MRFVWAILKREVRSYLVSPLAYIATAMFLLAMGLFFGILINQYGALRIKAASNPLMQMPGPELLVRRQLGEDIVWALLVIVPLLTMRLLAEERRQHTAELLLTAPMTTRHIVLGKFLGCCSVLLVMIACTGWMPLFLRIVGGVDPAPIWTGYIGATLYGAFLLSIGLLASSLTESPIQSAFLAMFGVAVVNVVGMVAQYVPLIGHNLEKFTPTPNLATFSQGVIDTQACVYFITMIWFVLEITARVLDSQRWR